ncbi:antitermination protein [Pasteurellaceae bacterium Macca]|nr:antitermination protein [Pasteurellaceae bacterium Macca]
MSSVLSDEKKEWVQTRLNEWGAWAYSGLDFESRTNMIARLMQQADAEAVVEPVRERCDDELGLVISSVVGYCIKNPCPQDYKYLEAKYVYGCSVYAIAKYQWARDKSVSRNGWYKRVTQSLEASEWVVAKFLDLAIKNHKNVSKLQKFAFFS